MSDDIINPFKEKTNWAKKAQNRLKKIEGDNGEKKEVKTETKKEKKKINRVAKSFKIYPGEISRVFDKRVNKLQVHFDDLDMPKNYVDSGKYLMFLMQFAEKFKIYELYKEVDVDGNLNLELDEVKEFIKKLN